MRLPKNYLPIAVCAIALLTAVFSTASLLSAKKDLKALGSVRQEMTGLMDEYQPLRQKVQGLDAKRSLSGAQGIVLAVDEIFEPLGLKDRVKSVKPLDSVPMPDGSSQEKADVNVKGVTMNEMANILYSVENAPMLMLLKKINIKTSFEKPELIDMTMTLAFVKPASAASTASTAPAR